MKTKVHYLLILTSASCLALPAMATSGLPAAKASIENQYNELNAMQTGADCEKMQHKIQTFCTTNPTLANAQLSQQMHTLASQKKDAGAGTNVLSSLQGTRETRQINKMIGKLCEAAAQRCDNLCVIHYNEQVPALSDQSPANDTEALKNQQVANSVRQTCSQEKQKYAAAEKAFDIDLQGVMAALTALKDLLGLGDDSKPTEVSLDDDENEDECDGEYADLLIQCREPSGPKDTRADLVGGAGLTPSDTDGNLNSLFDQPGGGEPGGSSKGKNKSNSPFGSAGAGAGGFGMAGFGAGAGAGAGGSGDSEKGLDTDIQKGYMGVGGSSGGGGGGGSSRSAYRGSGQKAFGSAGLGAGMNKASLQKKLNKYAGRQGRAPASTGKANGPFDDNWKVVNKAYKKNSNTMFHQ